MKTLTKKAIIDLQDYEVLYLKRKEGNKSYHIEIMSQSSMWAVSKKLTSSNLELFNGIAHKEESTDEKLIIGFATFEDYLYEDFFFENYEIINKPF